VPIVLKSGSLSLLEPSGPDQACNGIALPFYTAYIETAFKFLCENQKGRDQSSDMLVVEGKGKVDHEDLQWVQLVLERVE